MTSMIVHFPMFHVYYDVIILASSVPRHQIDVIKREKRMPLDEFLGPKETLQVEELID